MNAWVASATRLGFDAAQLGFAWRTAVASFLAIVVAWRMGLDYPQWAGMTVWIASQPTRGHLVAKSAFRFAGTLVGALVGLMVLWLAQGNVLVLVVGLSAWSALCVGLGNVLRGYVSYASILSGYTAAMVALVGSEYSGNILELGTDRVLTVLTGVVVALFAGWFFTHRPSDDVLTRNARQSSGRVLRHLAFRVQELAARIQESPAKEAERSLLAEIAALEDSLDGHGAGSLKSRRSIQALRSLLFSQVSLVMWCKRTPTGPAGADLPARFEAAAHILETGGSYRQVRAQLTPLDDVYPATLRKLMVAFMAGLATVLPEEDHAKEEGLSKATLAQQTQPVVLHRDWVGARQALLRASGAMLLVGSLWWLTGWQVLSYMLLGTAIMTTLFSTFENPARTMRVVIAGQVMGVAGALACRWLLWPWAERQWEVILMMLPFILVGGLLMAHRRTAASGFDYNMVVLLLLLPIYPLTESLDQSLAKALAVLSAPILAAAAYRWVFPTNAKRRLETLIAEMVRELQHLALSPKALQRSKTWRARLYHRLMRLVVGAENAGDRGVGVIEGGAAVLSLGTVIFQTHELCSQSELNPRARRSLDVLLKRISQIEEQPQRVIQSLKRTAAMLELEAPAQAMMLEDARRDLEESLGFFGRESPQRR